MARILIVSGGTVGQYMAGPGVRSLAFARTLAREHGVILAAPAFSSPVSESFTTIAYQNDPERLRQAAAAAEVILLQGMTSLHYPFLLDAEKVLIIDLYDPSFLENLVGFGERTDRERQFQMSLEVFQEQLLKGDFFLCANERQRDLWLGMLLAMGRVNHLVCAVDPSLRELIAVVPFGVPGEPPSPAAAFVMKGVHPAIGTVDKVVLWGGGIWPWLDPLLAVEAMAALPADRRDVKLFFLSTAMFGGQLPPTGIVRDVQERSRALGLLGSQVLFNTDWVPYERRQHYLLEADAGIITHNSNLETHYSNRTRILDYLWAGLPVVTVRGDVWSEVVERYDLGQVVDHDPVALARALLAVVDRPKSDYRDRLASVAAQYTWDLAGEPLLAFCRRPAKAPDHDLAAQARWRQALQDSATQREKELMEALAWQRLPLWRKVERRLRKELARYGLGRPPMDLVRRP